LATSLGSLPASIRWAALAFCRAVAVSVSRHQGLDRERKNNNDRQKRLDKSYELLAQADSSHQQTKPHEVNLKRQYL
jgi:hypothetical protein